MGNTTQGMNDTCAAAALASERIIAASRVGFEETREVEEREGATRERGWRKAIRKANLSQASCI